MNNIRDIIKRVMDPICRRSMTEAVRAGNYEAALIVNNILYDLHYKNYHEADVAGDIKAKEAELDELDKIAHQAANIEKLIRSQDE